MWVINKTSHNHNHFISACNSWKFWRKKTAHENTLQVNKHRLPVSLHQYCNKWQKRKIGDASNTVGQVPKKQQPAKFFLKQSQVVYFGEPSLTLSDHGKQDGLNSLGVINTARCDHLHKTDTNMSEHDKAYRHRRTTQTGNHFTAILTRDWW